ncbi:alkane 1-monooxygenase [Octadecabacter sp. CECT 8868]|uniref:alkane 1-monooxygenase n=1 Tax=Octadecabacter algicola TaxID=2909342 RepID=UPI001F2A5084|nr:alkane 1-monooxygenase [Octadecabacter algicola]MCF2906205.1 alkane 1-monooxygenase [Octadecabacter algicola]
MTSFPIVSHENMARFARAAPFWLSMMLIPLAWIGAVFGGWTVILMPLATWYMFSILDAFVGRYEANADLETTTDELFWYRLVTIIWMPLQFITLFGVLWYVTSTGHLGTLEKFALFFGIGVMSGTVGIVYAHELAHQKPKFERWLADILLSMALYSHFRSEHLLVHHRYVGTPRDPVTARYNENFHRYFPRVFWSQPISAFKAERAMLARKNLPWYHRSNPFWRYLILQSLMITLACLIGGWAGLGLFVFQAYIAIVQLEVVNYVEHYGLTRKHLGDGKYEHVKPRHSWNADHRASNWLLINLQRHSDHHYKPDRRFPLLQTYDQEDAPQLPYGYPIMTMAAMIPPVWRRVMNPRVREWRKKYYPEIEDWAPYKNATNPMPR